MGRKGKAAPASSAKALEICGDTSKLGVSPADVFAQFGKPISNIADDQTATLEDVEVSLALQALQKKDPTTRLRAVAELRDLLLRPGAGPLGEVCAPFLHIYRRLWPQDNEPRVREGMQRCLQVLVENLQRDFAKHLRGAFPTWLCAMFDTHGEVTQAGRGAFTAAFPTDEKRRGVFRHCQKDCLELLTSNLRHSEQSLHDELGLPATGDKDNQLQRQDRYARVLAASLSALGELVHVCSTPLESGQGASLSASQLLPFFEAGSPCTVWPRLASKQPALIRRAAVQCLMRVFRAVGTGSAESGLQVATASHRAAALNVMADDAIQPSTAAAFVKEFAVAGAEHDCWEGLSAPKSLWPALTALLRRGAAAGGRRDAVADFLQRFGELLQVFPESAWAPGKAEILLTEILQSLAQARSAFAAAPEDAWKAYFGIGAAAGAQVGSAWRWYPVALFLGSRHALETSESPPPEVSLTPAAKAALPLALAGLSTQAVQELVTILGSVAGSLKVDGEGEGPSLRQWTVLINTLQTQKLASNAKPLQILATGQLRRLFLEAIRGEPTKEKLDALRGLLACDLGAGLDIGDSELQEALGSLGGQGPTDMRDAPEEKAKIFAWPILPWISGLRKDQAGSRAAREVAEQLLLPLLRDLARQPDFVPTALTECLSKVLLPCGQDQTKDSDFHAGSLRLALECVPKGYGLATTDRVREVVHELVGSLVAAGTDSQSGGFEEAIAALTLAFRPTARGGMEAPQTASCLRRLVSASGASSHSRHLTMLVSKTLSERESGEIEELKELLSPTSEALHGVLLAEDAEDEVWMVLSKLLGRAGLEEAAQIFARSWPAVGAPAVLVNRWVRSLLQAAQSTPCPALQLLCAARRHRQAAGFKRFLPEGDISADELHASAVVTGLVLKGLQSLGLDSSLDDASVLEVVWELLLAASLSAEGALVSGASRAWVLLRESSDQTKRSFLELAMKEAASEGGVWRVSAQGETTLPLSAHLAGLSPLRHMLAALWTDEDRAEALGAKGFLSWALSEEAQTGTLGWGHTAATVIRQSAKVGVLEGPPLLTNQAKCRAWIRDMPISGGAQITEQHLVFAAAIEEMAEAYLPKDSADRAVDVDSVNRKLSSDGPVITEVPQATEQASSEGGIAKEEPSAQEDLDTSLVESVEKLLRWSQAKASRADAFAGYAAALWPSVAKADSTSGRLTARMVRLALESLGTGPTGLASGPKVPASPGVWRLIAALCKAKQWPEANWQRVLQATAKASKWLLMAHDDSAALISDAFVDDACTAAAMLLPFAPAALAGMLAPLLAAPSAPLRAASARRLQAHRWLPSKWELGSASSPEAEGEKEGSWSAQRALESLEALLEADSQPPEANASPALASCADVAYQVLGSVFSPELAEAFWSVEDALSAVAAWETGEDDSEEEPGEDSTEPGEASNSHRGYGRRFRGAASEEGTSGDATFADPATPASSSRGQRRPWLTSAEQLPLPIEVEHACAAALVAWETLLQGIDQGLKEKGLDGGCRPAASGEKEGASPAELIAAVLQLTPDHLSKSAALAVFPGQVAPASHWDMPLQPLFRLLCHLLTSNRLTGFNGDDEGSLSEAVVSSALSETGDRRFDLLPLAARTLLLGLRLLPGGARRFWELLPRKRDQAMVERLISRNFSQLLIQAEASAANAQIEAERDRLEDIEASVIRRQRQLLLLLQREELRTELSVNLPPSFPLRPAQAEFPEKMPGIPKPRVRNWMLQARQVLSSSRPMSVGKAVLMWSKSFALFFKGVEDCPICYNVIQLTTQTIPRKACPTCKHKFHNECLYQWFRSSSKTTCPLCNQPF